MPRRGRRRPDRPGQVLPVGNERPEAICSGNFPPGIPKGQALLALSSDSDCHELGLAVGVSVEDAIGALDDQNASFTLGRGIDLP